MMMIKWVMKKINQKVQPEDKDVFVSDEAREEASKEIGCKDNRPMSNGKRIYMYDSVELMSLMVAMKIRCV